MCYTFYDSSVCHKYFIIATNDINFLRITNDSVIVVHVIRSVLHLKNKIKWNEIENKRTKMLYNKTKRIVSAYGIISPISHVISL